MAPVVSSTQIVGSRGRSGSVEHDAQIKSMTAKQLVTRMKKLSQRFVLQQSSENVSVIANRNSSSHRILSVCTRVGSASDCYPTVLRKKKSDRLMSAGLPSRGRTTVMVWMRSSVCAAT